ncbi:hypothetical protein KDL01_15485 [Actinospica durhamensis]|uniref:PKD domain-containing protein n=1 Tax=Actinospica durhamensis TaxID=1508375 RepID=A0A941ENV2_9ACTN|nr:right-handed parallel beta-helix repeat-containing protein [Actinospica durhamensis]MBR7834676.1 hypothetical protein [Actinospica durhamensis]
MPHSRRAATAALAMAVGMSTAVATAHADASNMLYVEQSVSTCTDSGTGTQAAPFCSITAAAKAVAPGDTVEIATGDYLGALDITAQGTAAAPITFEALGSVMILNAGGQTGPSLSFDGASYVTFEGNTGVDYPNVQHFLTAGVAVRDSSHVTVDGLDSEVSAAQPDAMVVSGASSDIVVTRDDLPNITVGPGGNGDVISTNVLAPAAAPYGISVSGSTNTDITSNSVVQVPASTDTIDVTDGSTGTNIQNNIIAYPATAASGGAEIAVDSSSTSGSVLDYNVAYPVYSTSTTGAFAQPAYSWADTTYADAAALYQATGQGQHDLNTNPRIAGQYTATQVYGPQVSSANSAAPGMLPTDIYGQSCAIDPTVAVSGTGTPDYCARGAAQPQFVTNFTPTIADTQSALGVEVGSGVTQYVIDSPETTKVAVVGLAIPAVSYTIDWGDGQSQTVQASSSAAVTPTQHTYAAAGTYTVTDTIHYTDGTSSTVTKSVTTAGSDYTPYGPARLLDTRKGIGAPKAEVATGSQVSLKVAGVGTIPAGVTAVAVNLTVTDTTANGYLSADGTATSTLNYLKGQTVANSAIVPVAADGTIQISNEGNAGGTADVIADVTGYFTQTTSAQYGSVPLDRILDTRHGVGAAQQQVPGDGGIPVTVAGLDGIPAGVSAVAVHVTVVNTAGNGWIAAEPDGAGTPTTSILNYLKGQTVSNTVIVPVAKDGKIELYNGGTTTPADLLADVSGYFSAAAPDAYVPVAPTRVWDSRHISGGAVPGNGTAAVELEGGDGSVAVSPYPASATLVANVTVTDTEGNGYLAVYPAGTTRPGISTLNYLKGQTVAVASMLGTAGAAQKATVYNQSTGSTDVIFDVFGYFDNE